MIEIELPWPHKYLNPNKSVNHRALNRVSQEAKDYAYKMTRTIHRIDHDPVAEKYSIKYIFHPPTKHKRDDDNFIRAMKSARDGVAKALDIDDSCFVTQPAEFAEPVSGGKVILRLEELNDG